MEEWTYPISINYRQSWGEWEAIREIVQNMMDSTGDFRISREPTGLLLQDSGTGLRKKHLLLGVSEKEEGARGKFGEGLKLALVVLKRLGYDVTITSNNLKIGIKTVEIEGETCLKLIIDETPNDIVGTRIFIEGYYGETFEENFVNNGNKNILYECKYGQIIDEEETRLYVKDIFVCPLRDATYSYNLNDIEVSEDRNIPSETSVHNNLGNLYSTLTRKNSGLVVDFLEAVKNDRYESRVRLPYSIDSTKVWVEAFRFVFGDSAVIHTSETWAREATWLGANPIELPYDISYSLKYLVLTDKRFTKKHIQQSRKRVPQKMLNRHENTTLRILKKIAKRVSPSTKVFPYTMRDPACYDAKRDIVMINKSELPNLKKSLAHLVHELAHAKGADDLTSEMIHSIGDISGEIIHAFIIKSLRIQRPKTTSF